LAIFLFLSTGYIKSFLRKMRYQIIET